MVIEVKRSSRSGI